MEPRPHRGGEKRVDSKADGPVFHPERGASTDKTGSQETSKDERKGKDKTVCGPLAECLDGVPNLTF